MSVPSLVEKRSPLPCSSMFCVVHGHRLCENDTSASRTASGRNEYTKDVIERGKKKKSLLIHYGNRLVFALERSAKLELKSGFALRRIELSS